MKRFISFFILCAALSIPLLRTSPAGAETKLADVVQAVERSYESLSDLQASFSQKTYMASMKREQTGKGTLYIRKKTAGPAMFRFDYTRPKQLIVSDGASVWFYLPDNRQVMVTDVKSMFDGGNGPTLNFLTGMGRISRDFKVSTKEGRDAKGNYLLELVPKSESRTLAKLMLTVSSEAVERFVAGYKDKGGFPLLSAVVYDHFGTRTTIEFGNVRVNRGVKASLFLFKVPTGVEVIKQ